MANDNVSTSVGSSLGGALGSAVGGAFSAGAGAPIGGMIGSALGGAAGSALAQSGALGKSSFEKYNEKRLKELQRRQELGTLGLTEAEKQALYNAQSFAAEKAAADIKARESGLAAALATGAGGASVARAVEQDQLAQQRAIAERAVQDRNLLEAQAQRQEIEDRMIQSSQAKEGRKAAISSIVQTGVGTLDESVERYKTQRGGKPTAAQLTGLTAFTGVPEEKLGPMLEYFAANPDAKDLLSGILAGGGRTGLLPK
jgi:hypothetical protein